MTSAGAQKEGKLLFYTFITAVAGLIAAVAAAVGLVIQVRYNIKALNSQTEASHAQTQALESQIWQSLDDQAPTVNAQFVEHPELYPYFFQKKKVQPAEVIYPRVMAMATLVLDYFDGFSNGYVRRLEGMEENGKYWRFWETFFRYSFSHSPALCARYNEMKSTYTEDSIPAKFSQLGCQP